MHGRGLMRVACLLGVMLGCCLMLGQPATAKAAAPGTGFADPAGIPRRPRMPDIDPVYRGPAVDTLATIRKRGALRVGVAVNEPMVMHGKKGELVGFSIDLARRLAEDLGVQIEFVETSWSSVIPDLLDQHFDLIASGLWVTLPRALVVNYTEPAAIEGIHLIAGTGAAGLKTAADFDQPGVSIAVYAGTIQEELAARRFPRAKLIRVSGDDDHLAPVLAGKAQAALVPSFAPQVIVSSAPDKLRLPLDAPLAAAATAMAVRKGDPDFLNYLNTWLAVYRGQGWLDERAAHWSTVSE